MAQRQPVASRLALHLLPVAPVARFSIGQASLTFLDSHFLVPILVPQRNVWRIERAARVSFSRMENVATGEHVGIARTRPAAECVALPNGTPRLIGAAVWRE